MSTTSNVLYPTGATAATKSLTVDATAGGVTPDAPSNKVGLVFFDVQDADVMWTFDGTTAPTASVGHRLNNGFNQTVDAQLWARSKFIRQAGTDARIQYSEVS
jgi:hypothetical protein